MKDKPAINFLLRNVPIHIINMIMNIVPNHSITTKIRGALIRPFLKECGKGFKLASGVIINKPEKLVVGENVYIAHNCWINANGYIYIDDNVIIGPFTVLASSKHKFIDGEATNIAISNEINIGKGSWLASHVVVTDGVKIGSSCLVAAGTVVTKKFESGKIIGGVPGKVIGEQK